jgi:hypothetical protein
MKRKIAFCNRLRERLQTAIAKAVNDVLNGLPWYEDYKEEIKTYDEKFGKEIKEALVKDTPFTTIFWNTKTRPATEYHRDSNAHGLSILFCVEEYPGGELNIEHPVTGEIATIHMKRGMMLIGRWGWSLHANSKVGGNGERYSFILYFDNKIGDVVGLNSSL